MPTRPTCRLILSIVLMAGLAACAAPSDVRLVPRESTRSPRLPSGVVQLHGGSSVAVAQPGAASCQRTSAELAAQALDRTNAMRRSRGLRPLSTDPRLQRAAEAYACEMARRGTISHRGAQGSRPSQRVKQQNYRPRITAENLAAGRFDLTRAMTEWARSPGHSANIMIPSVEHYGIGRAISPDGNSVYWTALYASDG